MKFATLFTFIDGSIYRHVRLISAPFHMSSTNRLSSSSSTPTLGLVPVGLDPSLQESRNILNRSTSQASISLKSTPTKVVALAPALIHDARYRREHRTPPPQILPASPVRHGKLPSLQGFIEHDLQIDELQLLMASPGLAMVLFDIAAATANHEDESFHTQLLPSLSSAFDRELDDPTVASASNSNSAVKLTRYSPLIRLNLLFNEVRTALESHAPRGNMLAAWLALETLSRLSQLADVDTGHLRSPTSLPTLASPHARGSGPLSPSTSLTTVNSSSSNVRWPVSNLLHQLIPVLRHAVLTEYQSSLLQKSSLLANDCLSATLGGSVPMSGMMMTAGMRVAVQRHLIALVHATQHHEQLSVQVQRLAERWRLILRLFKPTLQRITHRWSTSHASLYFFYWRHWVASKRLHRGLRPAMLLQQQQQQQQNSSSSSASSSVSSTSIVPTHCQSFSSRLSSVHRRLAVRKLLVRCMIEWRCVALRSKLAIMHKQQHDLLHHVSDATKFSHRLDSQIKRLHRLTHRRQQLFAQSNRLYDVLQWRSAHLHRHAQRHVCVESLCNGYHQLISELNRSIHEFHRSIASHDIHRPHAHTLSLHHDLCDPYHSAAAQPSPTMDRAHPSHPLYVLRNHPPPPPPANSTITIITTHRSPDLNHTDHQVAAWAEHAATALAADSVTWNANLQKLMRTRKRRRKTTLPPLQPTVPTLISHLPNSSPAIAALLQWLRSCTFPLRVCFFFVRRPFFWNFASALPLHSHHSLSLFSVP